ESDPDLKVFLLTGYASLESAIAAVEHFDGYLRKPVAPPDFIQAVQAGLESARLRRENRALVAQLRQANAQLEANVEAERRLRAEARAVEEHLTALLRDLDVVIWEADSAERPVFSFVSGRVEALLGYPLERWESEPNFWAEIVHPQDRELTLVFF